MVYDGLQPESVEQTIYGAGPDRHSQDTRREQECQEMDNNLNKRIEN